MFKSPTYQNSFTLIPYLNARPHAHVRLINKKYDDRIHYGNKNYGKMFYILESLKKKDSPRKIG